MVKYSFIVPVYNTSNYLKKCIDSLINQTYKSFEIIIVNDGSTDNSLDIINGYKESNKNIKIINQKNGGLSNARNNGVKKASGEYIIFVDSDDYVEKNLLENIDSRLNNEDVFRFQVREVENNKKIEYLECEFENENGKDAFKIISSFHFVEPAWCYAYKKDFYVKNKFVFKENCYHEDYGLIPYIILLANNVSCYNFIGYNYIIRNNSIMTTNDYNKTRKKAFDVLFQYKNLLDITKKINNKEYFLSYITNSAILKANTLNLKDKKRYIKELKKLRVYNYILDDSLSRKIKKIILKININLYIKIFKA